MVDFKHLEQLKRGAEHWNQYRRMNHEMVLDLRNLRLRQLRTPHQGWPNLVGANLSGADLSGADLRSARFHQANFRGANLSGANLKKASLNGACLVDANLSTAKLCRADLSEADLSGANLSRASLSVAGLKGANLSGANLSRASLSAADFNGADLTGADLSRADLRVANLCEATLARAILRGQDLRRWDLSRKDLRNVDFQNADLREVNLVGSNLAGATLTGARLWGTSRAGWAVDGVICAHVFFDQEAKVRIVFSPGEFERLHSEGTRIELIYDGGIDPIEITTLPALIQTLETVHPGCVLRFRALEEAPCGAAKVIVAIDEAPGDPEKLKADLEEIAKRHQAALRLLLEQKERRAQIEAEYQAWKDFLWPVVARLAAARSSDQPDQTRYLTLLFMDVKGFSKMADEERQRKLSRIRGHLKQPLEEFHGELYNMWGDALCAAFDDVNDALGCACMIQAVLTAAELSQRIGMDRGKVLVRYNPTTDKLDFDGEAVNRAARLEPLARAGQVLVSEEVRYQPDVDEGQFAFEGVRVRLKKPVGKMKVGDELGCWSVTRRMP